MQNNTGISSKGDYSDSHHVSQGLPNFQTKKKQLSSPRSNTGSSNAIEHQLPQAKRKSVSKMKMIQNQTI
jgi:hypothetical protein